MPGEPSSGRVPGYFLAAIDSNGNAYLKGAVEPFSQILPSDAKTLKDYSNYGLVMQFAKAEVAQPLTAVFKSIGSFFGLLANKNILYIPSGQRLDGKFSLVTSNDSKENQLAFLINEEGRIVAI